MSSLENVPWRLAAPALVSCSCLIAQCHVTGADPEEKARLPTFRIDHINVHTHIKQGHPGQGLHGGK